MPKYLGIIGYTSVDQNGNYPIERQLLSIFETDEDPVRVFRKNVFERLRGAFTRGETKLSLYELNREVLLD